MRDRHDLTLTLPWLAEGTERLIRVVAACTDDGLTDPSGLPGWTRAHLLGHLARNAEALGRLATWARTGQETPMYAGTAQRDAEIAIAAGYPAGRLRHELAETAADLAQSLHSLNDVGWARIVRSAQGRMIPATEIPWLRVREVWLHAIDLDAGASIDDLPPALVDLLLDDLTQVLSARDGCPSVLLTPTDRNQTWSLGPAGGEPVPVRAPAVRLAGWLTGRLRDYAVVASNTDPLPRLPSWI